LAFDFKDSSEDPVDLARLEHVDSTNNSCVHGVQAEKGTLSGDVQSQDLELQQQQQTSKEVATYLNDAFS